MRNKRMKLVMAIFLLFALTATTAYAYWGGATTDDRDFTINIGEGIGITVTDGTTVPTAGSLLVPEGCVQGANDVESLAYSYIIKTSSAVQPGTKLKVTANSDDISGLVQINVYAADAVTLLDNTNNGLENAHKNPGLKVVVVITLSEPVSEGDYNNIKNVTLNVDILFEME
ncbi:MAG: hypothetical protein RBQ97_03040 [Acholeplasma sp.]|nr:hypothetical protein [Acholeplasma sp.]